MNHQTSSQKYLFPKVDEQKIKQIITNLNKAEELVRYAEEIGKALAKPKEKKLKALSTSQIRAIFGEVRRIEGFWKAERNAAQSVRSLILLKPKMKYREKKEGNSVKNLVSILEPAIDAVNSDKENFTRFVEFFEAILAYHRAYGGS